MNLGLFVLYKYAILYIVIYKKILILFNAET
ncbi:MAG: hypothetical protein PWP59_1379 [Sphaerochaeta sp.]|jgi:hypothetical protein|nr:hypothetical protein [Sphaerochaeta sp.]